MSVYVGMDVHRKRSQIAVVGDAGTERRNRNVPNDPPSWCRSWAPSRRAPRSRSRPPTAGAGWSTYSTNSSSNRTWSTPAAARRSPRPACRNDKVDARTLAQLLRADLLPEAWIAPQQVRDQRALLGHRAWLGRVVTAAKGRVHAVLADRGVRSSSGCGRLRGEPGWPAWPCQPSRVPSSTTAWCSSISSARWWPGSSGTCSPAPPPTLESTRCRRCPASGRSPP